ncbi:pyruvate kinase [[Mycobacterium] burgundiense]|uniref:pyruvate kinase n=1 Tax=[Mycobacterium] burgundiense TaxID=3064286 RepID=A0ABN9N8B1_9MYCO|nr:pyruvate kinase [Mycolicibacterium sp. MU0053]CAJ1502154.1 pyruvate kinase [Mycolicibacterium sp. MU0053]
MTDEAEVSALRDVVDGLLDDLAEGEAAWSDLIDRAAPEYQDSARNMVHYLAIRRRDLRDTQHRLARLGLSSLGRSEPHVQATLRAVRAALTAMSGADAAAPQDSAVPIGDGAVLLAKHAAALLGPAPRQRASRIMVTMPSAAATDSALVRDLVAAGMEIARINCAHDDPDTWRAIAGQVRRAARETGRTCLVAADLAGPKVRTGPLESGPRRVKLRPRRNDLGRVVEPARAWLTSIQDPAPAPVEGMSVLPVAGAWLARRRPGDVLMLRDTRGSRRRLTVVEHVAAAGCLVTVPNTTYVATGTRLRVRGGRDRTEIGELPQVRQALRLRRGDVLELTRDCRPAPVTHGRARIGCTHAEVIDAAQVGHRVLFDDGKIAGTVTDRDGGERLRIRITHAGAGGSKLRADKGINLPDSTLSASAPTAQDLADAAVAAEFADFIEMSFVRDPGDVERLLGELDRLGAHEMGLVLKIETPSAFEHLPRLLITAMRRPKVGVMIARGDLAVECGYERLAELQEEILWLCEAAHLPVIWATQVLEQLAKTGNPSRAEISDAAMSERAECVMLNKGPYIRDAVAALDDILHRMSEHHYKKNQLLRPLRSWQPILDRIPKSPAAQRG